MAALLVGVAVMGILLSMALPAWRTFVKREREAELIFRGEQYVRAIALYQRKYANAFPPDVDILVKQRFLRRRYTDPMTKGGEFRLLYQGAPQPAGRSSGGSDPAATQSGGALLAGSPRASTFQASTTGQGAVGGAGMAGPRGGIVGVASTSTDASLRVYNGRTKYNEWQFVWRPASLPPGPGPGGPAGLAPGRGGRPDAGTPGSRSPSARSPGAIGTRPPA